MRTSLSQQIQTALIYTNSASQKLIKAQNHAVSGKRITAPSDDVPGTNKSLSLRSAINTTQQFTDNTTVNQPLLKATDSALQSLTEAIQSVRDIAVKAATPDTSGLSTETYTQQLDDIMVQIADIANTKHTDQFIFSGTATNTPAVSTTGNATNPYQYDGNEGTRSTQVLSWVSLQVNIPGSKVFNFDGSAGAGSTDVFAMVTQLKTAIESGDATAVSAELNNIDANLDNVLSASATIGSWESRMESAANTLADTKVRLKEMLSDTEDIDLTEAIVDLKTQENVYQTALSITSQILKMSITSMT